MTLLNDAQLAKVRAVRALHWTRPFSVETFTPPEDDAGDYYAGTPAPVTAMSFSGSWVWPSELSRQGSPGGVMADADLILHCSIVYSGALAGPTKRLLVEGQHLKVTSLSTFFEGAELVVTAKKVG